MELVSVAIIEFTQAEFLGKMDPQVPYIDSFRVQKYLNNDPLSRQFPDLGGGGVKTKN